MVLKKETRINNMIRVWPCVALANAASQRARIGRLLLFTQSKYHRSHSSLKREIGGDTDRKNAAPAPTAPWINPHTFNGARPHFARASSLVFGVYARMQRPAS